MSDDAARLSQIATRWSLLDQAHVGIDADRIAAQSELLTRYCGPVYHYLRRLVRDDGLAEDLCQEFALRFLRGDFRHADPNRGRFRDYLKASLVHLVGESRRRRAHPTLTDYGENPIVDDSPAPPELADRMFTDLWRTELLNRTWLALAEASARSGDCFHEVLKLKSDDPSRTASTLAELLGRILGRPVTPDSARQSLHRARQRFAELLRAEVAASVPTDEPALIDAELADLGLLVYLPPAS
jgi:RNA polymerase sigma-70 factor (ECF subfamily)